MVQTAKSDSLLECHREDAPPAEVIGQLCSTAEQRGDLLRAGVHQAPHRTERRLVPPATGFCCENKEFAIRDRPRQLRVRPRFVRDDDEGGSPPSEVRQVSVRTGLTSQGRDWLPGT